MSLWCISCRTTAPTFTCFCRRELTGATAPRRDRPRCPRHAKQRRRSHDRHRRFASIRHEVARSGRSGLSALAIRDSAMLSAAMRSGAAASRQKQQRRRLRSLSHRAISGNAATAPGDATLHRSLGASCHGSSSTLHRGARKCSAAHSKKLAPSSSVPLAWPIPPTIQDFSGSCSVTVYLGAPARRTLFAFDLGGCQVMRRDWRVAGVRSSL